ncbi:MAG: FliM/FliN family flagellar motor switch protein, partial [Sphingomonadaceae bacterium]
WLGLRLSVGAPAPRTAGPARAGDGGFAARARARVLDVALPVTLRLAGWRLPLGRVAMLKAGDVLPIEPPRHLDLMVGGERLARLPADRLLDRPASPPEDA